MVLNFTLLCLLVDAFIATLAIRRTTIASPISIFTTFNAVCLMYFYLTVDVGHRPTLQLSALPLSGLEPYSGRTAAFYAMLNLVSLPVIYSVPRIRSRDFLQMAYRFRFFLATTTIKIFLSVLAVLTLVHMLDFNLSYLWDYRGYHAINETAAVGISNPIALLYHRIGPSLGALAFCFAVICAHTKRKFLVAPAIVLGTYGLLLSTASSSREISIFFILPAMTHYFFKKRLDFLGAGGIAIGAFAILYATITRSRDALLGISNLPRNLAAMDIESFPRAIVGLLSNVAQGAIDFGHALRIDPEYPFIYKYVSMFSPLPGNLDGWPRVRDLYLVKIGPPNPISALGETYHFGWYYCAILLAVVLYVFRATTIQMFTRTSMMTLPIYGFTILLIYRLHHYPMRLSQRIILMILAFYVIDFLLQRRTRRVAGAVPANKRALPPNRRTVRARVPAAR